jgi:predicted component of type VI protein secretion system
MHVPEVGGHRHSRDALQVPNGAVHDQPAALRRLHDVVEELVADDGAAFLLAEEIHDKHVPRLKHVDRPLVVHARKPRRLRPRVDGAVEIRPQRHELEREGAADQLRARVEDP